MQIRCSKKGCKKHEQCSKMEPKWEPKSRKSLSKKMSENRCEKGARLRNGQEGRRVRRDAPSNVLTSQNVSSSSCKRLLNVWPSIRFAFLTPLRYTHRPETSPDVNLKGSALPADPKIQKIWKITKMSKMYFGKNMSFWKVWLKTDSIAVFAAFFYIG